MLEIKLRILSALKLVAIDHARIVPAGTTPGSQSNLNRFSIFFHW